MADFKKFNRTSGPARHSFNKRTASDSRELFDAECNSCHSRCQVPFRPNGKKPVYCSSCFTKGDSSSSSYAPRTSYSDRRPQARTIAPSPDRQIQELKKQLEDMNGTLQRLVTAVDGLNRASVLSSEVRKHIPAAAETTTKKKPAKRAAKKTTK